MKKSILLMSAASVAQAGFGFGKCPIVQNDVGIDLKTFQGQWYEIEKDWSFPMEIGAQCVTHEYRANPDGTADLKFRGW